jgi:oligopeptide transport system substrate-binding protein
MFASGEMDTVTLRDGDQIQQAKNAGYEVQSKSDGATSYFVYNMQDATLSNNNIRTALTYAIDRASLINNVLKDSSVPALSFTNPDVSGENGSFKAEVGDLLKDNDAADAKNYLEAGLKELGLTALPKLTLLIDDRGAKKTEAAAYQEFLKKNLGIEVDIEVMPYKAMRAKVDGKDFQIAIGGWGPDYNDPMTFLDMFVTDGGNNSSSYSSAEYDQLISQASVETDTAKRFGLLRQAETKLMQDLPIGPIYFMNQSYTVQPGLKDVVRSAFQDINLYWAHFE